MSKLYFFIGLLLFVIPAYAQISFAELSRLSTAPDSLQGEFLQEKYLTEIDAHIVSSGVFEYVRDKSIRWETEKPIQNILLMTPESIVNNQGENEIISLQAIDNPVVGVLSDIFFSVLTADWERLGEYFILSGTIADNNWDVELVPKNIAVMQVVNRVKLKGDKLLNEIIFFEKNGDQTTIKFDDLIQ